MSYATDYEQKATDANRADAHRIAELLGFTVTVDRNGLARINAQQLRAALESISRR
jgi:hypothetical protein